MIRNLSLADEIDRLGPWFHNLHLPDGTQTAPAHRFGDFPSCKWNRIAPHLPADLSGWRALDIGCNAGFYSFELARRGADVTAIDHDADYLAQARWAAHQLDPQQRVRFEQRDVYSLARSSERYDLVLFMGVLYHLRYPLLALDTLSRLEPRLIVVQTLTSSDAPTMPDLDLAATKLDFDTRDLLTAPGYPRMSFIEGTFADDDTNWWAPDAACVRAMMRSAGFQILAEPDAEMFLATTNRPRTSLPHDHQWQAAMGMHTDAAVTDPHKEIR